MTIPYVELVSGSGFEIFNFFLSMFITLGVLLIPVFLAIALVQRSWVMVGYCREDKNNPAYPYFCDWDNGYYYSLIDCYSNCYGYTLNNDPVHLSKADITIIGAGAGILFGAVFLFALFKALISG